MIRPKVYTRYRYHVIRVDGTPGVVSAGNDFAETVQRVSKWNANYGYRRYAVTCPPVAGERPNTKWTGR